VVRLLEHLVKLTSGPDFAEAFTRLDGDLKGIGSAIFDEITNIELINRGYTDLYTAITHGKRALDQKERLPMFGPDDVSSEAAVRQAYVTDDFSKRIDNDCANNGGTHWNDIRDLASKAEQYKSNNTAYEWRRSAPYLISAIPLRLGVIESMDPDWRTDRLFDTELYNPNLNNPDPTKSIPGHANGLDQMLQKMTGAIQCGAKYGCFGFRLPPFPPPSPPPFPPPPLPPLPPLPASCLGETSPTYIACADVSTGFSFDMTRVGVIKGAALEDLQAVLTGSRRSRRSRDAEPMDRSGVEVS
jgi:hypothetical protein